MEKVSQFDMFELTIFWFYQIGTRLHQVSFEVKEKIISLYNIYTLVNHLRLLTILNIPTLCTDFNLATYSTTSRLGDAKGYQTIDPYPTSFEADILFTDFAIFSR